MIDRIYFIGDYYRGDQSRNVHILYTVLLPLLREYNIETNILHTKEIFTFDDWMSSLKGTRLSFLEQCGLSSCDMIIGFEINNIDLDFLNKNSIPWINFKIHPIRFLDDLYFSIQSSFDFELSAHTIKKDHIYFYGEVLKLKSEVIPIDKNSLLIVGQTPFDKSVFFDDEFKGLNSYFSDLDQIVHKYDRIYYRHHPNLTNHKLDQEIIERYNATLTNNHSYYELLASNGIVAVTGISSSALHEANYFGKKVYFLESRHEVFSEPISLKMLYYHSEKWIGKFKSNRIDLVNLYINFEDNLLRKLYGNWSYPVIEESVKIMTNQLTNAEVKAKQAQEQAQNAEVKAKQAQEQAQNAWNYYHMMVNSNSWKITEPLRKLGILFRKLIGNSK